MESTEEQKDDMFDGESTGGTLLKWDTLGKSVTGLYVECRDNVKTQLGAMTVYNILTKDGEIAVPGTKDLVEKMKRIPANGTMIVGITFTEEKKGNFPNPFKVFSVKHGIKTEERLSKLGINDSMFDAEVKDEPAA